MRGFKLALVICLGLLGAMTLPTARASERDKKTIVTFNEAVEVPGAVLPAGTYVFRLLDSVSDRSTVQIFNEDETHLYATLHTNPAYRFQPPDSAEFVLRPGHSPDAIRTWFYPGNSYGWEFVYPKRQAMELAQLTERASGADSAILDAVSEGWPIAEMGKAPVEPSEKEVAVAEAPKTEPSTASSPASEPAAAQSPTASPSVSEAATPAQSATEMEELPKTGSSLPLVALVGFLALVAGLGLRITAGRWA
ncbi:MAG: LPXTG cell wall anchor domain-containing protein [Acidobacteria bacterium]|nr:LPXTG cell wall anchor domain-containing protein [Acidobacteriota bacterium]